MIPSDWRFLLDEHMPRAMAVALRDAGYVVDRVIDVGLRSKADAEILAYAENQGAFIITADLDFVDLVHIRQRLAIGLFVLRVPNDLPIWARNILLLDTLRDLFGEDLRGLLITIEVRRVRVKRISDPMTPTDAARS